MKHDLSEQEQSARALSRRLDAIGMSCLLAAWSLLFALAVPGVDSFLAENKFVGQNLADWTSHLFLLWNLCGWALVARRRQRPSTCSALMRRGE